MLKENLQEKITCFDLEKTLHELKHYLPSQAPLKDFVHHNTLHAFQHEFFHKGLHKASKLFGYQTYLTLEEYRNLFIQKKIDERVLDRILLSRKGENKEEWKEKGLNKRYDSLIIQRVGRFRELWKKKYKINLDKYVHPTLFRLLGSYLDQGISIDGFPINKQGFLNSVLELHNSSIIKLFTSQRVNQLIKDKAVSLQELLKMVVGKEEFFEYYLFDQQFAHPGWSGMAAVLNDNEYLLLDKRNITLKDFITIELLLEIDVLDNKFGETWKPLALSVEEENLNLFSKIEYDELYDILSIWQEAYEWSFFDFVLKGLQLKQAIQKFNASFQAVFCIDDRECSFRRYLEKNDSHCETFSTAGFFNVAFYFQPEHGKFYTKLCPAPQFPSYLIKEYEASKRHSKDIHFNKSTHGFLGGFIFSPTMGFWSMFKLAKSILFPTQTEALISSFKHMDRNGKLSIEANALWKENNLQLGFTKEEMADKVEGLLKGIGLVNDFAPLIYIIGHGASSVNNTHYAGYDCGACCGRAGSVNARVAAFMANHKEVRDLLKLRGIEIPTSTQFIGGLHDTTRDEIEFYDEEELNEENKNLHSKNKITFEKSLSENAKERARRFLLIKNKTNTKKVHEEVKLRSLSLFEPRPEWNHATNSLCIIGKRENCKHLFLDRRAFLNSYDYRIDKDGMILLGILNAVAPVCGGINLEYYFSRVDNYRLGAGTKLPHNVMGLLGVANGMDGDLRTGLPKQMINIHDPLRLLITVEHFPQEVLRIIKMNPATYEWFKNEWIFLVVIHPDNRSLFVFKNEEFEPYLPLAAEIKKAENIQKTVEGSSENLPVYLIN
ncbi:hypothetical protein FLAV_01579 [Flavobacteriales bacterium]|nr:hypothetical protein [Flavobacteriales bacterium]MCL4816000.1 DUF2309 family protein [Flavobacteriales bacterium]CAG0977401.1 hypothetical protein FLAV_01579 [Flavobacteriales bacterium]